MRRLRRTKRRGVHIFYIDERGKRQDLGNPVGVMELARASLLYGGAYIEVPTWGGAE